MPRAMVHPRLKQRIVSDSPSAPVSPEPSNLVNAHVGDKDLDQDPDADADADMDAEGESMNISDIGEALVNEEEEGDEASQAFEPDSNLNHGLPNFNSPKPTSSSQNNIKNTKSSNSYTGLRSGPATVPRSGGMTDIQQPSGPADSSSVRRSSRVKPPSSSKELPESRSPAKRPLKVKLRLGSKPTPELEDEKPTSTPTTRSSARKVNRGGRTRSKGKNAAPLTLTLPARASEAVPSRRSMSPSEVSPRTSPESEDDPDAEMDIYHEPEPNLEAGEVNVNEQDDENLDDDGDDDDDDNSEVLPGQRNRSRMTSRQAVLASKVDPEHIELDLTVPSRKKQLTTEEIALRREETARKRKNLNEKKLEDEKTETINRLLKKQSSRSRAKRSALNTSIAATPQSHSAGEEGDSDHGAPEKPKGLPGPAWRWISSKDGYRLGIPLEALETLELPPLSHALPSIPICDVQGCSQNRKYRLVSDFNRGACGMEHLKLLSTKMLT